MTNRRTFIQSAAVCSPAALLRTRGAEAKGAVASSAKLVPDSYIRKSRIADIDVAYEVEYLSAQDIDARVPEGTINFAAVLSIPKAVEFHFTVGAQSKEKHLRGLRNRWTEQIRDLRNVSLVVPDEPARFCLITSCRRNGMKTNEDAQRLQRVLFDKYRVHTVWREGIANGPVIRVTPGLYSTFADCDALAAALRNEQNMFL